MDKEKVKEFFKIAGTVAFTMWMVVTCLVLLVAWANQLVKIMGMR